MKLKRLIVILPLCCSALILLVCHQIAKLQTSHFPLTVKTVLAIPSLQPGDRVYFMAPHGCTCNMNSIMDPVLVLAFDQRESTVTVRVTPEQAKRLASEQGNLVMTGGVDAMYPPPPSWKRYLRLRGIAGF